MLEKFLFQRHLEDDEHVTMIVHKHWFIGIKFLILPAASFSFAWGIFSYWTLKVPDGSRLAFILLGAWAVGSLVWLIRNFLDYYLDAWIVTDHGIVDLEWLGWFHRQSARILYSDVQGVSYEVHGVLGTVLRYGTVSIEKISTGAAVSLNNVPRPKRVESAILKNMEAYMHTKNLKNASHVQELLSEMVAGTIGERGMKKEEEPEVQPQTQRRPTRNSFSSTRIRGSRSDE
jgi:hypothetical protein